MIFCTYSPIKFWSRSGPGVLRCAKSSSCQQRHLWCTWRSANTKPCRRMESLLLSASELVVCICSTDLKWWLPSWKISWKWLLFKLEASMSLKNWNNLSPHTIGKWGPLDRYTAPLSWSSSTSRLSDWYISYLLSTMKPSLGQCRGSHRSLQRNRCSFAPLGL